MNSIRTITFRKLCRKRESNPPTQLRKLMYFVVTNLHQQEKRGDTQIRTGESEFCRLVPYHLAMTPYKKELNKLSSLERMTRLELATSTLARLRSTR